ANVDVVVDGFRRRGSAAGNGWNLRRHCLLRHPTNAGDWNSYRTRRAGGRRDEAGVEERDGARDRGPRFGISRRVCGDEVDVEFVVWREAERRAYVYRRGGVFAAHSR